jgi:hypothetical protein
MQTIFHHVLPLAMPGILTGTIIGLAQALGETAPLLLIGMIAFIATNFRSRPVPGLLSPTRRCRCRSTCGRNAPRTRILRADLRRHHRPPAVPRNHERHRHHPAPRFERRW